MTAKLLSNFKQKIKGFTLVPAGGGCFEVTVNGELINALFTGLDALKAMKDEIASDGASTLDTTAQTARLRAVLRRSVQTIQQQQASREAPLSIGELWIDPSARSVSMAGKALVLTPVEYQILLALARAVGRVKTREQLLLEVAERDFEVFDRSIDVHVSSLRKKLHRGRRLCRC